VIIATNYIKKSNSQAKLERAERRNSRSSTHSPSSTCSRKDSDASAAGPTETKKVGVNSTDSWFYLLVFIGICN
jgi:hypothetical protein